MPEAKYKATIKGHPHDLSGLARLYKGDNPAGIKVTAEDIPNGVAPTVNMQDPAELERYRRDGYDRTGTIEANVFNMPAQLDWELALEIANDLVRRVNAAAKLLDPEFKPVTVISVSVSVRGGGGVAGAGSPPRNKTYSGLGRHPSQFQFAHLLPLATSGDEDAEFVIDALNGPVTWPMLYVIYERISDDVGGHQKLEGMGWAPPNEIKAFRKAASSARDFRYGVRHGNRLRPSDIMDQVPLHVGHSLVQRLALRWLEEKVDIWFETTLDDESSQEEAS